MPTTHFARGPLPLVVDDVLKAQAAETLDATGDESIVEFSLVTSTGRSLPVGEELTELLATVLTRVAMGGTVSIRTLPEILTTSAAADLLGVSRTTLMKLIHSGEIASLKVGTHHRLRHDDVIELKASRDALKRAAVQELLQLEDDE